MQERYVLLALGRPRAEWFARLGQWATTGAVPCEVVRCMSPAQVGSRLRSGRAWSAVVLDADVAGVDHDLLTEVASHGAVPIVVATDLREWRDLGAVSVLHPSHDRAELLEVLGQHATMIGESDVVRTVDDDPRDERAGELVAVVGPAGAGTSVTTIALAQGLAATGDESVLLADLCRVADQAMLHDSRVVVPSVQDIVDAHRVSRPRGKDVVAQTFTITERGYRLLLGLRRPRQWPTIRPTAFSSTLDSLQRCFDLVVCDIEADLEGEDDTGSADIEERHLMARSAALRAQVIVLVGRPGLKGVHAHVRVLLDLHHLGVPVARILPVITCAPRSPRLRAEIVTALQSLAASSLGGSADELASPIFLPSRKVDDALRDGVALPRSLASPLAAGVRGVRDRLLDGLATEPIAGTTMPERITPGSLGLEPGGAG
ncbi:hypothetical protein [Salsipaludibacter albus]|uniref:hypothetical protein n=1 Tax=Salsipaludibacter albus TaxID=2849650 RepID=UPI001EE426F9|nr:hypothetical protein [Salsipaludibacter albus]MBY5163109.1 hypothetical protein [Salsipaludibacter albus]